MQLTQEPKKVIRSGQFQESKFKIEASSKAFQILSSKLYSDEYRAIVRELCTNASDAHAVAGIKDPIVVNCPTHMNSTFSVEDFGSGIDPMEFEKIYTTYFYSTKTSSNTEVGCFGLGSKSPFAYTQQFTVENSFGGIKSTYTCFINENGEPSVTLLTQSPTDKSGVKVSFPVKREDFYKFQNAIENVLQWFDITPKCNITTITNNSFTGQTKQVSYDGMTSEYGIRMGQVVYPVDSKYFEDFLPSYTVINVNIGDVDITPSRESLEYRKKTVDVLEKLAAEFAKDFNAKVDEIMNCPNSGQFKKFIALHKFLSKGGIKHGLKNATINKKFPALASSDTLCRVDNNKFAKEIVHVSKQSWRKQLAYEKEYIYLGANTTIIIKDKSTHYKAKLWQLFEDNTGGFRSAKFDVIVVPVAYKDAFFKEYDVREEDVIYLSKYELDKDAVVSVSTSTNCCKYATDIYNDYKKSGTKITKDNKEGMYITSEFVDMLNGYSSRKSQFDSVLKEKGKPVLYIFTQNQYNQLKIGQRNFTNFLDMIKKEVEDNRAEAIEAIANYSVVDTYQHKRAMEIGEKTTTDNLFKQYYNQHIGVAYNVDKASYYEGLLELVRWHDQVYYNEFKKEFDDKVDALVALRKNAIQKYRLLEKLIDNSGWDGIIEGVVEYVDLMESKGE